VELVKVLVQIAVPADWILMLLELVDWRNCTLINRFADEDVFTVRLVFPIPTSKELADGIDPLRFCLIFKETYPLTFADIWFVGEKANMTCDPPLVVALLYLAMLLPLSFVMVV